MTAVCQITSQERLSHRDNYLKGPLKSFNIKEECVFELVDQLAEERAAEHVGQAAELSFATCKI